MFVTKATGLLLKVTLAETCSNIYTGSILLKLILTTCQKRASVTVLNRIRNQIRK